MKDHNNPISEYQNSCPLNIVKKSNQSVTDWNWYVDDLVTRSSIDVQKSEQDWLNGQPSSSVTSTMRFSK